MKQGTIISGMREAIQSAEDQCDELRENLARMRQAAAESDDPLFKKTVQTDCAFVEIELTEAEANRARLQSDLAEITSRN